MSLIRNNLSQNLFCFSVATKRFCQAILLTLIAMLVTPVFSQDTSKYLDQITISTDVDAMLIESEDGIDDTSTEIMESSEPLPTEFVTDQTLLSSETVDEVEEVKSADTELEVVEIKPATEAENIEIETRVGIESALQGWAYAWAKQDVEGYLGYYADEFIPDNSQLSKADWIAQRKTRLLKPKTIELDLSDIELKLNDEPIKQVIFKQSYKSDTYQDKIIKSMSFIQELNKWKILTEQTIETL